MEGLEPAGPPPSDSLRNRVWQQANTWDKAYMQQVEDGAPDPRLIDRIIISIATQFYTDDAERAEPLAHQMTDDEVATVLSFLDEVAAMDASAEEKAQVAKQYLTKVLNIIKPTPRGVAPTVDTTT